MKHKPKSSPALNRNLFWDVDFDTINWEKNYAWVIVRVFERGDVEDIRQCRRYYGDEKVKHSLLNTKFISRNRIFLAAAVIDEPINKFRCYTPPQSSPSRYPY